MRRWIICLVFSFLATNGFSWETDTPRENSREDWKSLYASFLPMGIGRRTPWNNWNNNEHAQLAHMALEKLGVGDFYSIYGLPLTVIDLNSSIFRRALKKRGIYIKYTPRSALEERLLPQPVHFAGLPDISYTMYDWINKNAFCPPTVQSGKELCHVFKGWMGALNSSHFGTQAELWYRHLHETAVALAGRAREMREKMEKRGINTVNAYKDYINEAEYEALAFEGYAQHFLQDRWSMGHMWERWNAADYDQLVFKGYYDNFETAAASGLMHGSQSITGAPDPLSSPYLNPLKGRGLGWVRKLFGKSSYITPTWRHTGVKGMDQTRQGILQRYATSDTSPHTGIGDNRVKDMIDHLYGKEFGYPNRPLEVGIQKDNMIRCMMGGWVDVIRGLGSRKDSGGYGLDGVKLPTGITGLAEDGKLYIGCFDNWATNRSMALGWTDLYTTFGSFARIVIGFIDENTHLPGKSYLKNDRTSWVRITYRVWRFALTDPDGTDLARGAIGSFGRIKHGGKYRKLPKYIEPEDLDDLPDELDSSGRDKQAVFGFFNRAHTDWWCDKTGGLSYLDEWRGSDDKAKQAACRYIADRYYAGSDRAYHGKRAERRTIDGLATGEEIYPVCSMYNSEIPDRGYSERLPVTLAPGYIAEPYARSADNFTTESIANWCRKIPVLELLPQPENRDVDLVALVSYRKDTILLRGYNLGDRPGKLMVGNIVIKKADIEDWDHLGILFHLDKDRDYEQKDYPVKIIRSDGVSTVGRFFLRIRPEPPKPAPPPDISGCWKGSGIYEGKGFISIFQTGNKVTAKVPLVNYLGMKPGVSKVEVIHTGIFDPPNLTLSHRAKDFSAIDRLLWGRGIRDYPEEQRNALLAFGVESKFELHVVRGSSGDFLLMGGVPTAEFHFEGTHYPFAGSMDVSGWMDSQVILTPDENTIIETDYGTLTKDLREACPSPNFLLYDVNESDSAGQYICWRPLSEHRSKEKVTWQRVADTEVESLTISKDANFTTPVNEAETGENIWIRASASSSCSDIRDRLDGSIYIEGEDYATAVQHFTLMETGPDTSEFRSKEAVPVPNSSFTFPGRKIIISVGLKGKSMELDLGSSPTGSSGKVTTNTQQNTPAGATGNQTAVPVKPKQKATKPVHWTAYKLRSFASRHEGGLPKMNIIGITFRRDAQQARFSVKSYPLSLSRNDRTGEILWSVNWSNEHIVDQATARNPAPMDILQQKAEKLRKGTVARADVMALIGRRLGSKARRLK